MFDEGFPSSLKNEFDIVHPLISRKPISGNVHGFSEGFNSENEWYFLSDGSSIRFPYRIYYADDDSA